MNPFGQQSGIPMFNQSNHPHRRVVSCCMGIPYGIGVPLVLTSWIVAFYSHLHKSAMIVFGVLNLIFVVVCCFGYSLHLIKRSVHRYRQYAKLLACCVAILILDMLANFILFCIQKDEFEFWCHTQAKDHLNLQFRNNAVLDQSSSSAMFNCSKLFRVEAEFSFACMVLMLIVYAYWVSFIIRVSRNFILLRPEIQMYPDSMRHQLRMQPPMVAPTIPPPDLLKQPNAIPED
ncbi:hypothetical protein INT47_007429, partial [Mucor saturninus]